MAEYRCIHTMSPVAGCDNNPIGLLCYAVRDESIPRVDLSCELFGTYHYYHRDIAVLLAWKLNGNTYGAISAELRNGRDNFREQIGKVFDREKSPQFASQRETIEKGVIDAYEELIKEVASNNR